MKLKSEKGITNIDVILSIILISIFITLITVISGNLQKSNDLMERETEALYYAVDTIEDIKGQSFDILPKKGSNKIQGVLTLQDGYILDKNGETTPYYRTITVQDYTDLPEGNGKQAEILKKITVEIAYKERNQEKKITLSTIKTKGD